MTEKEIVLRITNTKKVKDWISVMHFNAECTVRNLPTANDSKIINFRAFFYENIRPSKSLITSTLKDGEINIDDVFYIESDYQINYSNINWAKEKGCFKYTVVSIQDPEH